MMTLVDNYLEGLKIVFPSELINPEALSKPKVSYSWSLYQPEKRVALVTGINGQDGSYLAEWLLSKEYTVYGIVRRASTNNLERIRHILSKVHLIEGDITDAIFMHKVIETIKPHEIYNLAAQSHVQTSFSNPNYTYQVNTLGLLNILNSVKELDRTIGIYQASTSEMFGNTMPPQNLDTNFEPESPYACSKLAAHYLVKFYRSVYNINAVSGILFNHESPRRGENFVTKKIVKYFGDPMTTFDSQGKLRLGNINSARDWGFAPDYVEVMQLSLQTSYPKDFVLGTEKSIKVSDFLDLVGEYIDVNWHQYVQIGTAENSRDQDVFALRAKSDFRVPTDVKMLVKIMMDYEIGFPDPMYNDYVSGEGYEYYMENYGKIFAWRT